MSDSTDRILRRISKLAGFAERLEEERRIEVIRLARVLAIAGLPKRQVDASHLSRTLRVGAATWLRVTYSVDEGAPLPYGADRFVLAGIQHLALEQDSRTVLFNRVGELLHTFGLSQNGRTLGLLRQRFKRIAGLSIRLRFGGSLAELDDADVGEQLFIIRRYSLPTGRELRLLNTVGHGTTARYPGRAASVSASQSAKRPIVVPTMRSMT